MVVKRSIFFGQKQCQQLESVELELLRKRVRAAVSAEAIQIFLYGNDSFVENVKSVESLFRTNLQLQARETSSNTPFAKEADEAADL